MTKPKSRLKETAKEPKKVPAIVVGRRYRVTNHGTILVGGKGAPRKSLRPGQEVVEGHDLPADKIPELLKSGHLVRLGQHETSIPGTSVPAITHKRSGPGDRYETPQVGKTQAPTPAPPNVTVEGLWNLDPKPLAGKSLMELNAMVLERDKSMETFTSETGAIDWLSQDFHA